MGAGLLAKAVYQGQIFWLTLRFREQARSHTSPLPHFLLRCWLVFHDFFKGETPQRVLQEVTDVTT